MSEEGPDFGGVPPALLEALDGAPRVHVEEALRSVRAQHRAISPHWPVLATILLQRPGGTPRNWPAGKVQAALEVMCVDGKGCLRHRPTVEQVIAGARAEAWARRRLGPGGAQ